MKKIDFKEIVEHLKGVGYVYPSSDIYGGLANFWDMGPLGAVLKSEIKNMWIKEFVYKKDNNFLIDSQIILNNKVWENSGHVDTFSDLLIDCKECKKRYKLEDLVDLSKYDEKTLDKEINKLKCPNCKKSNFSKARHFNLMFEINSGITDGSNKLYLRPETAQGIFLNFKKILRTTRTHLPIGVAQIGKSFRNEISPGNFIFRTREFEQMELELFVKEKESNSIFNEYKKNYINFIINLGIKKKNLKNIEIDKNELAHYAKRTVDILYNYPFGWSELMGIANRGSYDLEKHQKGSGEDLTYLDPELNKKIMPHIIEPSIGVERLMLAILCDSFEKEKLQNNEERIVMKINKKIAPIQIAVMPLTNKIHKEAFNLYKELKENLDYRLSYEKSGSIGKRYRRHDAIGTPFVITFDFDSIQKKVVTIRNRDTMEQVKVKIDNLEKKLFSMMN